MFPADEPEVSLSEGAVKRVVQLEIRVLFPASVASQHSTSQGQNAMCL